MAVQGRAIWGARWSYLLILPILLLYFIFSIVPILQTFRLSFYNAKIISLGQFVGFKNYLDVLQNNAFGQAFANTVVFTAASTGAALVLALLLAVLVNARVVRFKTFFKAIFFLPVVTSIVAAGYVWKWMYDPTFGIINVFLGMLGLQGPYWLVDPDLAMTSMIAVNVWKWIGYFMVILLANMQLIDQEIYEAANMDGANSFQQFFFITVPLLRPAIGVCVVLGIINFLRAFAQVFVMTQGGPAGRTEVMATLIYREAFGTGLLRIGFASAASMLLFAVIMIFTLMSNRMTSQKI